MSIINKAISQSRILLHEIHTWKPDVLYVSLQCYNIKRYGLNNHFTIFSSIDHSATDLW